MALCLAFSSMILIGSQYDAGRSPGKIKRNMVVGILIVAKAENEEGGHQLGRSTKPHDPSELYKFGRIP